MQDRSRHGDIPVHRVGRACPGEPLGADDMPFSFERLRVSDLVDAHTIQGRAHTPLISQLGVVMCIVGNILDKRDAAIHDAFGTEDDEERKEIMLRKSRSFFF